MNLLNNPFNVLGLSPRDNRKKIMEIAKEKNLSIDSAIFNEASSILTHPKNRLMAEIAWMPDVMPSKYNEIIRPLSESKGLSQDLKDELKEYSPITQLNILTTELEKYKVYDIAMLGDKIINLDQLVGRIEYKEMKNLFNANRIAAGFPEIEGLEFITHDFNDHLKNLSSIINNRIASIGKESCVELITFIVNKTITNDNYNNGIIINSILDWYESYSQSFLEEGKEEIHLLIQNIEDEFDSSKITNQIESIIIKLALWDEIANPLQVYHRQQGLVHELSKKLGIELRNLAIFLHNDYKELDVSEKLIISLRKAFEELDEFTERIDEDIIMLDINKLARDEDNLIDASFEEQEDFERSQNDEIEANEKLIVSLGKAYEDPSELTEQIDGDIQGLNIHKPELNEDEALDDLLKEQETQIETEPEEELGNKKITVGGFLYSNKLVIATVAAVAIILVITTFQYNQTAIEKNQNDQSSLISEDYDPEPVNVNTSTNESSENNVNSVLPKNDTIKITLTNGDKYEGGWKDDKRNGKGTTVYLNGDKYAGNWKDDKKHGFGTMIRADGAKYEGEWKNDIKNGIGTYIWPDGSKYEGGIIDTDSQGYGVMLLPNGDKYEGYWLNNNRHGNGTMIWSSGDKYKGNWENDKAHGYGSWSWADGETYEGNFKNGLPSGKGNITYADGSRYEGDFLEACRHGYGIMTYPNGDNYKGYWIYESRSGQGTYNWASGQRYDGNWSSNKMNGYGTMIYPGGTKYEGNWENNIKTDI